MPSFPLLPWPMASCGISKATLPQLQVTIFGMLQSNLNYLDFSLLLPDVMTVADEVDAQLTQSMDSYRKLMRKSMAA
jgi:hypothetical protein